MLPRHALAFLAGILCVEHSSGLEGFLHAVPLLVGILLICGIWGPRLVGWCAAGTLWALVRALTLLAHQLPPEQDGSDWLIRGDVISLPAVSTGQSRFDFAPDPQLGLPYKLQLTWFDAESQPRAAERWQLRVRLRAARGFANPGGFDYEGSLFRDGIGATGYVRRSADNLRLAERAHAHPVLAARAAIARHINEALRGRAAAGVIAGLAVGATQGISATQWQVFTATGTTHLIAISGLHVTMVAALAMLAARWLWRLPRRRLPRTSQANVACLCGAIAAASYALLAGFSVPTQRTLAMLLVGLGSTWLRRAQPASQVLSVALIAVLLIDPHSALTPGFWLSFIAVAAILAMLGSLVLPAQPLRAFFTTQHVVSLALLPATLLLFGSVSLVAPLANLVAIPAFSCVLVPVTLLGTLFLGLAPTLAQSLFGLAGWCMDRLWPVLEWAARLPAAIIHPPTPSIGISILLVIGVLAALLPLSWSLRLPSLLLVPLLLANTAHRAPGDFTITTLDVGQGLAVVVQTKSHVLLFDAGPRFRNGRSAGELAVVPYLHNVGVRALDLVIVSHADSDHSGGVAAVERALSLREVRRGDEVQGLNVPTAACERGEAWIWDEVRFEFLSPGRAEHWSENEGSCVLEITNAHGRALLTGDIEASTEGYLAGLGMWRVSDVIVIPHHGSRSSSSVALVDSIAARYAIVSAGARNRWHFPHSEVVERWCRADAQVISTADWGAISVDFNARSGMQPPHSYRVGHRHYWSAPAPLAGRSLCPLRNGLYQPNQMFMHIP
jgi:competence protein ComEC